VAAQLRSSLNASMHRVAAALRQGNLLRRAKLDRIAASPLFRDPRGILIADRRELMAAYFERCEEAQMDKIKELRLRLDRMNIKLEALNPSGVLERGYTCVSSGGRILSSATEVSPGELVKIHFKDGSAQAEITRLEESVNEDEK